MKRMSENSDISWFQDVADGAAVRLAADGSRDGRYLEPRLWEPLRRELQRRWRRATGEDRAVIEIISPDPLEPVEGYGHLLPKQEESP